MYFPQMMSAGGSQPMSPPITWRERRTAVALYLCLSATGHLAWEILQLPLYGLWRTATIGELAFSVLHCTAGDVLIAASTLALSLVLCLAGQWPRARRSMVAGVAIALGVSYTGISEWLNVYVRNSWSYGAHMPTVAMAGYDIGASPLVQWALVPLLVFAILYRQPWPPARS